MAQQAYPPPPPPAGLKKSGFHGPATHFFLGIRTHLTRLEQNLSPLAKSPRTGLIIALILGATLSFVLSFAAQLATGMPPTDGVLLVLVAPFTEEIFKGLSILIVALLMWKMIPNRRYGALLGAAAGFGFSISENILYSISYASLSGQQLVTGEVVPSGLVAELIASRWLSLPFMHVLWSAFVGIGLFAFLAQRKSRRNFSSPGWLILLFSLLGLANHVVWNALSIAVSSLGAFPTIALDVGLIFIPFALIFRDFLGGHFNFWTFLEPVPEPLAYQPTVAPSFPPPPPPPPPA